MGEHLLSICENHSVHNNTFKQTSQDNIPLYNRIILSLKWTLTFPVGLSCYYEDN